MVENLHKTDALIKINSDIHRSKNEPSSVNAQNKNVACMYNRCFSPKTINMEKLSLKTPSWMLYGGNNKGLAIKFLLTEEQAVKVAKISKIISPSISKV